MTGATPFDWNALRERQEFQATLAPDDPRHDRMFEIDRDLGYVDIYWSGHEYSVELEHVATPARLLGFLAHILTKHWRHSTPRRAALLVRALSQHFGWNIHGGEGAPTAGYLAPRTTSNTEERAKLTPKLRYDVLLRDDFRCRACGYSVEEGAHLHIDHVTPISGGGRTVYENLQALCWSCNMGKGARK